MSSSRTRSRVLCSVCYESFEPSEEVAPGDAVTCSACVARRARVAAPAPSPGDALATSAPSPTSLRPDSEGRLGFFAEARAESAGKLWWVRAPLWIYFAVVFGRHVFGDGPYRSLFDGINLGIHELGHVVFRPFGEFLHFAGGTILQLAAPIAAGVVFFRQRDFFAISVALCWLATNLWGISIYVGDARTLELHLVAPGMGVMPAGEGGILHDWNHLLGPLGLLPYDQLLAGLFRWSAVLSMLTGLGFGAWVLWQMARQPSPLLRRD